MMTSFGRAVRVLTAIILILLIFGIGRATAEEGASVEAQETEDGCSMILINPNGGIAQLWWMLDGVPLYDEFVPDPEHPDRIDIYQEYGFSYPTGEYTAIWQDGSVITFTIDCGPDPVFPDDQDVYDPPLDENGNFQTASGQVIL